VRRRASGGSPPEPGVFAGSAGSDGSSLQASGTRVALPNGMITIKRILCPLDFSRFSRHAFEQAVAFARETGAEIRALHACAVAPVAEVVTAGAPIPLERACLPETVRQAVARELRDLTSEVDAAGVVVDTRIHERDAVTAIVESAERWPADLIVMGTHGRSGF